MCFSPGLRVIPTDHTYVPAAASLSRPLVFSLEDHAGILGFLPPTPCALGPCLLDVSPEKGEREELGDKENKLSPVVMELSTNIPP